MTIGEKIKKFRIKKNLTQKQLAYLQVLANLQSETMNLGTERLQKNT